MATSTIADIRRSRQKSKQARWTKRTTPSWTNFSPRQLMAHAKRPFLFTLTTHGHDSSSNTKEQSVKRLEDIYPPPLGVSLTSLFGHSLPEQPVAIVVLKRNVDLITRASSRISYVLPVIWMNPEPMPRSRSPAKWLGQNVVEKAVWAGQPESHTVEIIRFSWTRHVPAARKFQLDLMPTRQIPEAMRKMKSRSQMATRQ